MPLVSGSSEPVLVVEDEVLVRMFAVDVLEDAGFKVDEVGTAAEALARFTSGTPLRAAVIDLGLPDGSGAELAAELLKARPDLPIVIASGRSERELRDKFAAEQRVRLLVKPYTGPMMLDALAELGVTPAAGG